jgi:hypothetical protein
VGAIGFRVYRNGTGAQDDVTLRMRVGQRCDNGKRKRGGAKQGLLHGSSIGIFKIYITNGNEQPGPFC